MKQIKEFGFREGFVEKKTRLEMITGTTSIELTALKNSVRDWLKDLAIKEGLYIEYSFCLDMYRFIKPIDYFEKTFKQVLLSSNILNNKILTKKFKDRISTMIIEGLK